MAFKKIPLTIDTMIRNPVPVEGINQEDNIELNIVVTENKTPKDLSSQTIKVYVRRIDGTLVEQTDQITPTNASKGEVTVKLKNSAFNKEGYALFQLDISDSSGRITSSYATFKVGKGLVSGEAIANTNEIEALKKIEEYIKKANQELETFKQTVAEINENEATRQENEVVRVREEASRNKAEAIRVQQEATRKEKENERVQAETKRIADEEVRRENEVLRGSKELERKQAEELRKEKELLRIEDENNRKVAESKRIEAESVRVEAEKLRVTAETGRVEAENLRATAEEARVAAETKREEGFNKFEGRISANTEELKNARSATTGEKFNTLDERIDHEVDRLNKKIEVSMLQQEDKESHTIENTVDGMTTDMIIKGRTLVNLSNVKEQILTSNKQVQTSITMFKPNTTYTQIVIIKNNTLSPANNNGNVLGLNEPHLNCIATSENIKKDFNGTIIKKFTTTESIVQERATSIRVYGSSTSGSVTVTEIILEGDWTNKPIPQYFEGIKSFGQQENKISSLSQGKNLFNPNNFIKEGRNGITYTYDGESLTLNGKATASDIELIPFGDFIHIELNKNYKLSYEHISGTTSNEEINLACKNGDKWIGATALKRKEVTITNSTSFKLERIRLYVPENTIFNNYKIKIQLEEGIVTTQYEPYKFYKKDILLQNLGFDEGLRGINDISDELNSLRNVAIKRIGKREYREGDELLENIITDKTNTYYVLEEPMETPLGESINVKTFGERTYVSFENSISGTSSFKAPVNTLKTIARLSNENTRLKRDLALHAENTIATDEAITDYSLDMDYKLCLLEMELVEIKKKLGGK